MSAAEIDEILCCPRCSGQNPNVCTCIDHCGEEGCAGSDSEWWRVITE